ncbi:MAG: DUF4129 domain-containing protein [Lewinellaceae bacterium]|nr:DUF4129 domain-containing protein [Lewinellaceae bacterium]MCB9355914.1 DUF4129 domain-containing protein [Lewinellaceae bacterium]
MPYIDLDSVAIDIDEEIFAEEAELPSFEIPQPRQVAARPLEKGDWQKATGGLDYSKDQPEPPEEPEPPSIDHSSYDPFAWTSATQGWGTILQGLAVAIAILAIAYGIYRILQTPQNRVIARDGVEITVDNLEEYLHETDLSRFLNEALSSGNYPLAVRLFYLQGIKTLSEKKAIQWSREKTNRDYVHEMDAHAAADQFRRATLTFEQVWYGNRPLNRQEFERIEPQFRQLLASI